MILATRLDGVRRLVDGLRLLWRVDRKSTLLVLLGNVMQGGIPVAAAWFTKEFIDALSRAEGVAVDSLARAALGLVLIVIIAQAAPMLDFVRANLARAVEREVQSRLVSAINQIDDLAPFETPSFHDRLRVASEAGISVPAQLTMSAPAAVTQVVTIAGFFLAVYTISALVAWIALIAAAPALFAQLRLSRARVAMVDELSPAERRRIFYTSMQTDDRAAKEIRLFGLGHFFLARMLTELASIHAGQRRIEGREARTQAALGILAGAIAAIAIAVTAWRASQEELTAGDVVLFLAMITSLQSAAGQFAVSAGALVESSLMLGRYERFVAEADGSAVVAGKITTPSLTRGITIEDVWFRYRDDLPWVLRGTSFTLRGGEATALVGLNGAGKSTLVKILCGLYSPTHGRVLWDGQDIAEFDPATLRQRISAVFQDYMSYDLTAAENLALGDLTRQSTKQTLERAARTAGADEVVRALPDGWDTLLSRLFVGSQGDPKEGTTLSGGEWQRLAIARMCMRLPNDFIVLDEPSSGLDAEAEHDLHVRLARATGSCTRLLISHRLNTVREADSIIVLDGGHITEVGTHDELMLAGGRYSGLFRLQASGYSEGATDLASPAG